MDLLGGEHRSQFIGESEPSLALTLRRLLQKPSVTHGHILRLSGEENTQTK